MYMDLLTKKGVTRRPAPCVFTVYIIEEKIGSAPFVCQVEETSAPALIGIRRPPWW